MDFGGVEPEECDGVDPEMTIGELMEWRYFKAEKAKELVSLSALFPYSWSRGSSSLPLYRGITRSEVKISRRL